MKGFVDLQVNGFLGVDFSTPGLAPSDVALVTRSLRDRGTIAYCPTVITSSMEVYESNLPVLAQSMADPDLAPHLLGIHLEGPFISPEDGARGAHPREHTQLPSIEVYEHLRKLAEDRISLVTLAPELPGSGRLISHIRRTGAAVAIAHHLADRATIRKSCERGTRIATHLGNGIPNSLPRHPNPIWDQLAEDDLTATVITDGHHVPESFIRVVARAKGAGRFVVVSDSAPIAGSPPGQYEAFGHQVVLEKSGLLWNPTGNHLVGSSSYMMECMNYLAGLEIFSEEELWQVGYHGPLDLIEKRLEENDFPTAPDIIFDQGQFRFAP